VGAPDLAFPISAPLPIAHNVSLPVRAFTARCPHYLYVSHFGKCISNMEILLVAVDIFGVIIFLSGIYAALIWGICKLANRGIPSFQILSLYRYDSLVNVYSKTSTCLLLILLGLLAILADCGYIYWEHNHGNQGSDMMRGIDYPVMIAMCTLYLIFFLIPSMIILQKFNKYRWIIVVLNGSLTILTSIGFLSLLF
jgi:hypothetical protein